MGVRRTILGALLAFVVLGSVAIGGSVSEAATPVGPGWNNVPYLGNSAPPSEALAVLQGQYEAVYKWDRASQQYQVYAPGAPEYVNNLTQLNTGDAIWVNVSGQGANLPGLQTGGSGGPGNYSVAASTFVPMNDLAIYEKTFNELRPLGTDEASKRYFAPVHLPDGATITSMTAAYEAVGGEVQVRLDYTPLTNGSTPNLIYKLVEVLSGSGASPQTGTAYQHTVDNRANVYFLVVDLTGGAGTKLRGVSIAYSN